MNDGLQAIINSRYFEPYENWGDPAKVSPWLIRMIDVYRGLLGQRVHISPVEGAVYAIGGHTGDSWHYVIEGRNKFACAIDVFPEGDLMLAWMQALKMRFNGVGVYPHWCYLAKGLVGGLHLDARPLLNLTTPRALWWRDEPVCDDDDGYRSVTEPEQLANLMNHLE